MVAATTDISQLHVRALVSSTSGLAQISGLSALVIGIEPSEFTDVSALQGSATVAASPEAHISQLALLVLVRGDAEAHRMRAWSFSLNGHLFYVLRLGQLGTVVYDVATKKWSSWQTDGFNYWRAHVGMNWDEEMIAGDAKEGFLWNIDPDANYDDGDVVIQRICVGALPERLRNSISCNGVMLTGSVGFNTGGDVTVTLRTSDDNGATWDDHGNEIVTAGDFKAEIVWRSLGLITAPGRWFEITDTGLTRLDGLDMW